MSILTSFPTKSDFPTREQMPPRLLLSLEFPEKQCLSDHADQEGPVKVVLVLTSPNKSFR